VNAPLPTSELAILRLPFVAATGRVDEGDHCPARAIGY
jgi:hypothetical protein